MKIALILFMVLLNFGVSAQSYEIVDGEPDEYEGNSKIEKKSLKKEKKFKRIIFDFDPDIYYTAFDMIINLTSKPIPEAGTKSESVVYKELFLNSFVPRTLLLEVSVNPMPVSGFLTKKYANEFYNKADISKNLNWIRAVTYGFEEPYAASLFLGNVMAFTKPGEERQGGNLGFMGYLFNIGNYHLVNNDAVEDIWYELEWKLTGKRRFSDHVLSWAFKIGLKNHDNPFISDVVYFGIRRSLINYIPSNAFLINNAGIEYKVDVDYRTWAAVKHYFSIDKKWPYQKQFAFKLALGIIWESHEKYSGPLVYNKNKNNWQFVFRPNIEF